MKKALVILGKVALVLVVAPFVLASFGLVGYLFVALTLGPGRDG